MAVAAHCRAVTVWVSGHRRLGLVQELNKVWPSIMLKEVQASIEPKEVRVIIMLSETQSKLGQQELIRSSNPSVWEPGGTSKVT